MANGSPFARIRGRAAWAAAVVCLVVAAVFVARAAPGWFSDLGQPPAERLLQRTRPHSASALWSVLKRTRIHEDDRRGLFTAAFPLMVRALAGQTVAVSGFMLPLEPGRFTDHFLLSRYTPVCFFCPPGAPNEVIEVRSDESISVGPGEYEFTGRFGLQDDGQAGLFFRLDQAESAP